MTQTDQILQHLQRYGSITPLKALNSYDCFRLAVCINRLRGRGHAIETHITRKGRKQFATYTYYSEVAA